MCEEKKSGGCAKWQHCVSLISRIAGTALAAAAAAADMATASQWKVYTGYGERPRIVTYRDFPAYVYLVVVTSIAALLEAIAVFLSVSKKRKSKKAARVLMPLLDVLVPELLSTSAGAAFDVRWDIYYYLEPIGHHFSACHSSAGGRFCEQVHMSILLVVSAIVAVSIPRWCYGGGFGTDSGSDSESDSESVCGHGCHCKH